MFVERQEWPRRRERWIDVAWAVFAVANLIAMLLFSEWETVPFHFIWVSLTLLYGFRVWRAWPTMLTLAVVMVSTAALILIDVRKGVQPLDEIAEVPLMAAMFLAMVWHARRRLSATQELERMYQTNVRLLERERRFVQDASHELRTPITVALGHAELIQGSSEGSLIAEDAQVVVEELTRLRRLAERLLLLAASEHPDFVHKVPVEIEPVVVETLRRWTPVPRRWVLGDVEEATVEADPDRLALALDALIENAVKHTRPEDSITMSVRRLDGSAIIAVEDTGAGIAEVDQVRIFDRFARSDAARSREGGGVGLGLAIVRTVAEAHGGSVTVRSTPGVGSVFQIVLPMTPRALEPVAAPVGSKPDPAGPDRTR